LKENFARLIAQEDGCSKFKVCYNVYPTPTSEYSVEEFRKAIKRYNKPEEILSDHRTTLYAVESDKRTKKLTDNGKFSIKEKMTLIVGKVKFFNSVDDFVYWYNFIRPHGAFYI
jgi:putative transposase